MARSEAVLSSAELGSPTRARVCAARVLVSLLPDTLAAVARLLGNRSASYWFEVHFALFCYLDVADDARDPVLSSAVLQLAERYLLEVNTDTALAAWMAAHMLTDHWNAETARPVLTRVLRRGRWAGARCYSLYALDAILPRRDFKSDELQDTLAAIRRAATSDRSPRVRRQAGRVATALSGSAIL
jgi:hypothetical protein